MTEPETFEGLWGKGGGGEQAPESVALGATEQELGSRLSNSTQLESTRGKSGGEPDRGSGLHGGKGSIRVRDGAKQLRSEENESHWARRGLEEREEWHCPLAVA